jgi:hypothetical protein
VSISKFVPAQMDPSDVTHIPSLFNALCPVSDSFSECSEELTMVLVHLAVNDFSYFCDTCVPVLIQPSFLNVNAKAFFDAAYAKTLELGGDIVGEYGVGYAKVEYLPDAVKAAHAAAKAALDPKGILNPGKIV